MNLIKTPWLLLMIFSLTACESCKEEELQSFEIINVGIDAGNYTGGGTLRLLYSTTNISYSENLPKVKPGTRIWVTVDNGTEQLSDLNFAFDWSGSTPAPADASGPIAEFTVTADLAIEVKVSDIVELITHRDDGTFLKVDKTSGIAGPLFTARNNGEPLPFIRAFVYHPTENRYYASVMGMSSASGITGGFLYTVDPATKSSTVINENSGIQWENIHSWVVGGDDSLIAVGDFGIEGEGIVKFGKDGRRSRTIKNVDICCGAGLVFDQVTNQLIASNGWTTGPGEIDIQNISVGGSVIDSKRITNFINFPLDMTNGLSILTGLARDGDGTFYGVMQTNFLPTLATEEYYFVKVDLTSGSIHYISTLAGMFDLSYHKYYGLTFIPKHLL